MLKFLNNIELQHDDIPSLFSLREKGRKVFTSLPDKKCEAYKYTPIASALTSDMFKNKPHQCQEHCHCHEKILPFNAGEFHFCNGILHEHFHQTKGIEIQTILDAISMHNTTKFINHFNIEKFPFAALNTACLEQGVFLRISKEIEQPIAFCYHGKEDGLRNIRNIIVVEKGASAEIVEVFEGENEISFTNIVNEIFVLSNARLIHYKIQKQSDHAVHIALNNIEVNTGGQYESYTLQTGCKLARNETHIALKGENASAIVNAAYNAKKTTLIDTTTDIEHLNPQTKSSQLIKGVLEDEAHGVFQGKIHIAPMAIQTQGYQLHKALLLSDQSGVDVKPELEIFADDVKCSHGATSGDLNPEEIFYLQSRGICENDARHILTTAFLGEAFADIKNESVKALFSFSAPNQ